MNLVQRSNKKKIKKTIYLHIGMGKTGTGALQNFFKINNEALARNHILYPASGSDKNQLAHHVFAASLWRNRPYWMPKPILSPKQFIKNIIKEANKFSINKILISSELLFFVHPDQIGELYTMLSHVNLIIICYIRRIDSFLPSSLHQAIKAQGIVLDSPQYKNIETVPLINNLIMGVSNRLKKWLEIFPKQVFVLRPYEKKQLVDQNIFSDFLEILAIKSKNQFEMPSQNFNPRLTREALEYKRLVNRVFSDTIEKTTLFRLPLIKYSGSVDDSTTASFNTENNLLPPETLYQAYKKNAEFYEHIAREYLDRKDGKLFYDPLPDPNIPWNSYPGITAQQAMPITKYLLDHYPNLIKSLYNKIASQSNKTDEIMIEARNIFLPGLRRYLDHTPFGHKTTRSSTKPTIFIHVGTAKTGTTAIQNFICQNLDQFSKHGIYYPATGRTHDCHHGIAFCWGNHHAFKKRFNIPKDQLSRLAEELYLNRHQHILISSECLLMPAVDWQELKSILPHDNIKAIIYLRKQDSFLASRYRELVKGNQITQPPEKWIKHNFFPNEYLGILSRLSNQIGQENIIVRIYEKGQFVGGSIFSDFSDIFHLPFRDNFVKSHKNFNPHLSRNALEFNRLLNTVFTEQKHPYLFNNLLTQYSLEEKPEDNFSFGSNSLFSPYKCREIHLACEKVNMKIAREYLGRQTGQLFFEPPPDVNESWEPYPGLSKKNADKIVRFLFDKNPQLTLRLNHALEETASENDHLKEAKSILLPSLQNVISKTAPKT